ncbi:divalent-cation tolerance protein CutA [Candidatus Uhrbacteria bacterium]|nr:divalent-cation tolerance protein CutA [Candidatus Uhrbacteria bacterium]
MIVIFTTCGSRKEAERIARALLRERLIACVNMWPVRSVYRFKAKVEQAREWAVLCKTRNALARRLEARLYALHSYDLPVIEQWEVKRTSRGVLKWIAEVTR